MNKLSSTFAPLALLAICTAPLASAAPKAPDAQLVAADEVQAQITSVDLEKSTFNVKQEGRELTITFDARTQFMLDGEKSSADRVLAVGRNVSVSHDGGKASKVSARSKGL
jgi:hypothetical protein